MSDEQIVEKAIEKEIRKICTYHSEPDEISGKEGAGTSGYCLSEEQFERLFTLCKKVREDTIGEIYDLVKIMPVGTFDSTPYLKKLLDKLDHLKQE